MKEWLFTATSQTTKQGLYLWGGVGSGKTMLMDLFYHHCPIINKQRHHFNSFMLSIHQELHQLRIEKQLYPLETLCQRWSHQLQLICLDEFQVLDVADAMILRSLLEGFLKKQVYLVITSNRPPRDLYRQGIQRDSFIPCIELLENRLEVIQLGVGLDYRQDRIGTDDGVFFHPINTSTSGQIEAMLTRLRGDQVETSCSITAMGRTINIQRCIPGQLAYFTFAELCQVPRSAADYSAIASSFPQVIITAVPMIKEVDIARRFITLIDILYDQHIKLILQLALPHYQIFDRLELCKVEEVVFAVDRTISRLHEMSFPLWWAV